MAKILVVDPFAGIPISNVISERVLTFYRGRKMRKDGKPCPAKPHDAANGLEPESLLWIGYRIELFAEYEKKRKVARMLGMPDPELKE